jgi:hypothetical protein
LNSEIPTIAQPFWNSLEWRQLLLACLECHRMAACSRFWPD